MSTYIKFSSNNDYTLHNSKIIETDSLYKKCGFKKEDNFIKLFTYNSDNNILEFWGRTKGDSKNINTYNLAHYNFNDKIYGKFLCLIKNEDKYISFNEEYFKNIDSKIYDIYNKNNNISDKSLKNNVPDVYKDSFSNSDQDDDCFSSEPIYDSELQDEDYNYSE